VISLPASVDVLVAFIDDQSELKKVATVKRLISAQANQLCRCSTVVWDKYFTVPDNVISLPASVDVLVAFIDAQSELKKVA
jgi:hypothetical protein